MPLSLQQCGAGGMVVVRNAAEMRKRHCIAAFTVCRGIDAKNIYLENVALFNSRIERFRLPFVVNGWGECVWGGPRPGARDI